MAVQVLAVAAGVMMMRHAVIVTGMTSVGTTIVTGTLTALAAVPAPEALVGHALAVPVAHVLLLLVVCLALPLATRQALLQES